HPTDLNAILKAERDASGAIVDWIYANANRNVSVMLGRPRSEVIGKRLSELVPERAAAGAATCKHVLETREIMRYESEFGGRDLVVTLFAAGSDYVVSSVQDTTEQRNLQRALQETDRRKDEFLAMLAHELRNP